MKKKYILLTGSICTIGGAQIYARNKAKFLNEAGWDVDVFSYTNDEILIDELRCFKKNIIDILMYPPDFFFKRTIKKVIKKIISNIKMNGYKEVVIESNNIELALWGELIASQLQCKHIIFLLHEDFKNLSLNRMHFFDFKHKRKELAGIHKNSLELLFNDYKKIEESEKYELKAVCTNSVDDVPNLIIDNIQKKEINIGCISRLDKNCVKAIVDEVISFANANMSREIQLVLVGGSVKGNVEKDIQAKVKSISNLEVIMTGRIFPIPRSLFSKIDIFIQVAGSAYVSALEGVLTLTLDVRDNKPIGLLGYDTFENIYSDFSREKSISSMLDDILIRQQIHKQKNLDINLETIDFRKEFINHFRFIYSSTEKKDYYDILTTKKDIKYIVKKYIINIFGINGFEKLVQTKVRIMRSVALNE